MRWDLDDGDRSQATQHQNELRHLRCRPRASFEDFKIHGSLVGVSQQVHVWLTKAMPISVVKASAARAHRYWTFMLPTAT